MTYHLTSKFIAGSYTPRHWR